ncbi:MAG: ribosome silencing factor [Culturomica sp.]|jgi:ribosome-associated protein|nr:ribosome silencing factor [Culturomica sp.]
MQQPEKLTEKIVESLDQNKGEQIVTIDLRRIENCFCRFFVICHGNSNIHVATLADGVREDIQKQTGEKPFHTEGLNQAQWVVVDYGDVIVHIFQEEQRNYYQLEEFWGDGIRKNLY